MFGNSLLHRAGALALATLMGTGTLPAQQYWSDPGEGTMLRADFLKPFFKGEGSQFLSGVVFLSASGPAGKKVRFEMEVPLVRAGYSTDGLEESSLRIGNPYLGARIHSAKRPLSGYIGVRLPLATEYETSAASFAGEVGVLSDPDRLEAFLPDVATARIGVELRKVSSEGVLIGARLGPSVLVPAKGDGVDPEMFVDYGVQGGYEGGRIRAAIGITGRFLATESGGNLSDRTNHTITGTLELRQGRVRPNLLLRMPLDDSMRESIKLTAGFGLAIVL